MPHSTLPAADAADRLTRIEHVARLLDSRFRFPIIGVRVGWDSILGLIPGVGDAITTIPAGWMIWHGYQMGARKRTLARMGLNAGIDLVLGGVPVIGDLFDVAFKSHKRNLSLLQREMQRRVVHASIQEVAHV